MRAKDAVGKFGEEVAARHLLDDGFEILDRNWRCARGELDIVARDATVLVFCEVKTRSSESHGTPLASINAVKVARLRRLAVLWLVAQRADGADGSHGSDGSDGSHGSDGGERSDASESKFGHWPELRFDVVGVLRSRSGPATVTHLRAAF